MIKTAAAGSSSMQFIGHDIINIHEILTDDAIWIWIEKIQLLIRNTKRRTIGSLEIHRMLVVGMNNTVER